MDAPLLARLGLGYSIYQNTLVGLIVKIAAKREAAQRGIGNRPTPCLAQLARLGIQRKIAVRSGHRNESLIGLRQGRRSGRLGRIGASLQNERHHERKRGLVHRLQFSKIPSKAPEEITFW